MTYDTLGDAILEKNIIENSYFIEQNWRDTLKDDTNNQINKCLDIFESSTFYTKNITKPFNLNITKKIQAHSNWITSLILLQDGRLASCGGEDDKTIRIWNLNTCHCDISVSLLDISSVYCRYFRSICEIEKGILVSGGIEIRIWKIHETH